MFLKYIIKRILWAIPVILIVSIIVFSVIHMIPGDPVIAMLGTVQTSPEVIQELREQLNLDKPIIVQYFLWLKDVLRGDLGYSIRNNEPVLGLILRKLPATALLALSSLIIAVFISIIAGVTAAHNRNTGWDFGVMFFAILGISIPAFWLGIMLILFFSLFLGLLPSMGYESFLSDPISSLRHLILPSIAAGFINAGYLTRVTRSEMIEVLNQDYIRTARSKGLKESIVIYSHAMKNALIPVVTAIGMRFAYLMGGTVIIEQIFAWPGIGRLVFTSITSRDYPVVQGVVLVSAFIFVMVNLVVDILYTFLDPRVKLE
jgi:peptide/nickel transport system permease protein